MKKIKKEENPVDSFVTKINELTEKAEDYTAEKLDKLEKKAKKTLDNSKASITSQARTLNQLADNKLYELKSSADRILFE